MKRTITLKSKTLLTELTQDFLENVQEVQNVKKSTLNSLINFSKSLEIKKSLKVQNLNYELISN